MSEDFPVFFFDSPSAAMRVDSRQATEELLASLTASRGNEIAALLYLMNARARKKNTQIKAAGVAIFGYGDSYTSALTLREWLDDWSYRTGASQAAALQARWIRNQLTLARMRERKDNWGRNGWVTIGDTKAPGRVFYTYPDGTEIEIDEKNPPEWYREWKGQIQEKFYSVLIDHHLKKIMSESSARGTAKPKEKQDAQTEKPKKPSKVRGSKQKSTGSSSEESLPIQRNCRWCETANDITAARRNKQPAYCSKCGHRVEGLPVDCDCRRCVETKRLIDIRERKRERKQKG